MSINQDYKFITFEQEADIGVLTLNRPDKLNALNPDVLTELKTFLTGVLESGFSMKGLIFTGSGEKAFIAGADIAAMSDMGPEAGFEFGQLGQAVTLLFEQLQVPVIACVNGFALGGGCEMAMACDFIYATQSAIFGQPEVNLGLIPGFGGTQRLAKYIGRNRAKEFIYSGRNLPVADALEYGLVNRVFDNKEEMLEGAKETLKQIAKRSPYAVSIAKKVMNKANDFTVAEGLKAELDEFSNIFSSHDQKEGCTAFVEKRKPEFKGE